jgi:hypothetical protein
VRGVRWPPKPGEALPRAVECWYEQVKLHDWVLAERGHGREWSRVFHLGPDDGECFWEAISAAVLESPIATVRDRGKDGVVCGIEVELTIEGRTAPVTISWHYEDEEAAPRLVTAYPTL